MRFLTLALCALGLAGFTVCEPTHKGDSSSHFSIPPSTYLSRWHPTVTNVPTRSIPTTPVHRRELTRTEKPICSSDSSTRLEQGQTSVCTEPATTINDQRPCATSWYKFWVCTPTKTRTASDWGGRRTRWIAQVAARSTQDLGGRSQRSAANFAARSTQNLGGRSQRAVARFAEATITFAPTPVAADTAMHTPPLCYFDLSKGEYVCPEVAPTTQPIYTFDPAKGDYICPPTPKVAVAAATPAAAAPCPEGIEMCVPRNEVVNPEPLDLNNHATTLRTVNA